MKMKLLKMNGNKQDEVTWRQTKARDEMVYERGIILIKQ